MTAKERKLQKARLRELARKWDKAERLRYMPRRRGRPSRQIQQRDQLAGQLAVVGALGLLVVCMGLATYG